MPAGNESITGPRLEFVLRKLPGTVTRSKYRAPPTAEERKEDKTKKMQLQNERLEIVEEAGYMIFFPTGNSCRLTTKQMLQKGYDREPNILSFEQANDQKTAAGRFKLARTERGKQKAWEEMEQEIITLCVGRFGKVDALVSDYDPKGKIAEKEAA